MKGELRRLEDKKSYYGKHKVIIPKLTLEKYELDFAIRYTYESTKIEGNTLSLIENKLIIEDRISVGGKPLKEIHEILMNNIMPGGIYRYLDISITGASHKPPSRTEMHDRLNVFYCDLETKAFNPIEKATWIHAEFVAIHPFTDGNGRTSRMLMNYILMENGYLPVNIKSENKISYYKSLDEYGKNNSLDPFIGIVINLEEEQLDTYISLIEQILENNLTDNMEP